MWYQLQDKQTKNWWFVADKKQWYEEVAYIFLYEPEACLPFEEFEREKNISIIHKPEKKNENALKHNWELIEAPDGFQCHVCVC